MAKRVTEKRKRYGKAQQRRNKKQRARRTAAQTKSQLRQDKQLSKARHAEHWQANEVPCLSWKTLFGYVRPPALLVSEIKRFDWRRSFVELASLAALLANNEGGATSDRVLKLTSSVLDAMGLASTEYRVIIDHARRNAARNHIPLVIAHEECIVFLQHLVLLHGAEGGDGPGLEIWRWLLGASDHLDWLQPDDRDLSRTELLAAEVLKVTRFNRSSVDEMRLLLRAEGIFGKPPGHGPFADPESFHQLQLSSFGSTFTRYFESFIPWMWSQSLTWGDENGERLPIIHPETYKQFGTEGQYFIDRLAEFTATREQLQAAIRKRMRPCGVLPQSPTALLHTPFVDLGDGHVVGSSPWYVRESVRSGIWARYLAGAKKILGNDRGGYEWLKAFGQMLEVWCASYAQRAEQASKRRSYRVLIPTQPGAADEIEDVVSQEGNHVVMYSVKARLVREDVARHALSRTTLLDWYERYFFAAKSLSYDGGVAAQLDAKIIRLRAGDFEPRVARDVFVYPVLVTFDNLCGSKQLYEWLVERCRDHRLLQQVNVGPLTLATVADYERLVGAPVHGKSPAEILSARSSPRYRNERLEVVLAAHDVPSRLPDAESELQHLVSRATQRFRPTTDSVNEINSAR